MVHFKNKVTQRQSLKFFFLSSYRRRILINFDHTCILLIRHFIKTAFIILYCLYSKYSLFISINQKLIAFSERRRLSYHLFFIQNINKLRKWTNQTYKVKYRLIRNRYKIEILPICYQSFRKILRIKLKLSDKI